MTARERMLAAIRRSQPDQVPHPGLAGPWIEYPDPVAQFREVLETVGGQSLVVPTRGELGPAIRELPVFSQATQTLSLSADFEGSTVELSTLTRPAELADLDVAIATARLGVAENAALWLEGLNPFERAACFLCQHLVLIVGMAQIKHNLHEAYALLQPESVAYGVWVSGPSKTADIEQSLVIGAHGPRSLNVLLLSDS